MPSKNYFQNLALQDRQLTIGHYFLTWLYTCCLVQGNIILLMSQKHKAFEFVLTDR
jgi:hypothetical protein